MNEPDSVKTMQGSVRQRERLCPRMWRWFKMPTTGTRTRRYTEQQVGADGVTRPVELSEDITERMSIVIELNTEWYQKANRYPSVDIVYANGDLNLPMNWPNPNLFDPAMVVNARENEVAYYASRDAWTFTLGYETDLERFASRAALPQFGCARAEEDCNRVCSNLTDPFNPTGCEQVCTLNDMLAETVWVGVRCSWGVGKVPCYFDLEYTLLPRHMSDGDVVQASIGAGEHHYFTVELGPFDVLAFELTRRGVLDDNFDLTQDVIDEFTGDLVRAPAGHGIIGHFLGARDRCPRREELMEGAPAFRWPTGEALTWPKYVPSPPPSPLHSGAIVDSVDEVAGPFGLTFFCTQEAEQGRYAFAVAAAEDLGPFEMPFEPSKGGSNCKDGYVGPAGRPLQESYGSPGALPACNPNANNNEMKANVGRYTLSLRHRLFDSGPLSGQEVRPGCASFGQWRRYTVTSTNTRDANIYVQLSMPVSALLLRAGAPPTLEDHDRMLGPEGNALTLSPCDLSRANVWHIAYYIAPEAEQAAAAAARGGAGVIFVAPTELTLTVQLQDAQVESGTVISPRADGGDGFVCCGAMKLFLVPITSALKALQVSVNVTAGAIRAVFLKHKACPVLPADIEGDQCVGLCHMSWYASYDRFTGALQYARANTTRVPKGDKDYPDKRAAGDWYIGIEASDETTTEFRMEVEVINHGMPERVVDCDRYGRFACGNEVWEIPKDIEPVAEWDADMTFFSPNDVTEISAAAQLAGGRSAALRASGASSVCTCALLSGWGLWLGVLGLWRTRRAISSSAAKAKAAQGQLRAERLPEAQRGRSVHRTWSTRALMNRFVCR